jgi:hypothetical protein
LAAPLVFPEELLGLGQAIFLQFLPVELAGGEDVEPRRVTDAPPVAGVEIGSLLTVAVEQQATWFVYQRQDDSGSHQRCCCSGQGVNLLAA